MNTQHNKSITITKFQIQVSRNDLIESGYFIEARIHGILPGCRKVKFLSVTPMAGYVWLTPLFDYNGNARISPADWRKLVNNAPVVESSLEYNRCSITPEIETMAREYVLRKAESAERQLKNDDMTCQAHRDKCASGEIYTPVITSNGAR